MHFWDFYLKFMDGHRKYARFQGQFGLNFNLLIYYRKISLAFTVDFNITKDLTVK